MKKILLVLVGGTICTGVNDDGILSISDTAGVELVENFKNSVSDCCECTEFTVTENLGILSENLTTGKWNKIIDTYKSNIKRDNFDGVIFAHGTDTLAYTAALFSQILAGIDIPVFFVSANARLSSSRSNGNHNFRCAVECICRGIEPNVYAVYKNISDEKTYLHMASRLEQCRNYSEDFKSAGAIDITGINSENFTECFDAVTRTFPRSKVNPMINYEHLTLKPCVMVINPYVGMDYSSYDYSKYSAVLHGTYHSGTACADDDDDKSTILYMIDKCAELSVDAYFAPSKDYGEIYETVKMISDHIVKNEKSTGFLYGYTNEMAYVKLLLAYSYFEDEKERKKYINTECNFEFIDNR